MRNFIAALCVLPLLACTPESGQATTSGTTETTTGDQPIGSGTEVDKGKAMHSNTIVITTNRGQIRAQLADNDAARALAKMLPLELQMRDHLRQEKTGVLPTALPEGERRTGFSAGTLGLWGDRDFVIYYRDGHVPAPGIVILGQVSGDLSQFDNAERVTVSLSHAD